MREARNEPEADARLMRDISALADGSLDPKRAERVSELIASSSALRERYEGEQRALAMLRELREDRAPHSLRLAIDARRAPRRRARLLSAGALVATVAAAVVLLVLLLPGGSPGAPSISQAAALALRGATLPAPSVHSAVKLNQDVQELYFPNWKGSFGWEAAGKRVDRIGGHVAVTVYYKRWGKTIAYTILDAPPLRWTNHPMLQLNGIRLQGFADHGRLVVTWRRGGHTCILSGAGATVAELAKLAGWEAPGL
jgi:hypothetical protein